MTVTKEGDRWVARPKVLQTSGYAIVTACDSRHSAADAIHHLRVATHGQGIWGALWMTPAQFEAAVAARDGRPAVAEQMALGF